MFGNLGAFVNGNMFMGLFGADVGIRVSDSDKDELVALGGGPFGPESRPMASYVSLPRAWRGSAGKNAAWTGKALDHVSAMPAKAPAVRKKPSPRR